VWRRRAKTGAEVRAFSEVRASEFVFEAEPLDPTPGVFRVETTEPMICAIVWGETDDYGRFNNSLSMNGTGIIDHDVSLPDIEPGRRYHFVLQGTTADGTLYRSEPGTFTIELSGASLEGEPTMEVDENLALRGSVADVSSEFSPSFARDLAIDGDLATEWSTAGDGQRRLHHDRFRQRAPRDRGRVRHPVDGRRQRHHLDLHRQRRQRRAAGSVPGSQPGDESRRRDRRHRPAVPPRDR
jgi:hypothetical protein